MNLSISNYSSAERGFTLVELAVVAAIIGFLSTAIIISFSRTRIRLDESTAFLTAQIRIAESNAISSSKYNNYNPCGYGVHYIDSAHFALYAGPNAATTDCAAANRNYDGSDALLGSLAFQDPRVQFTSSFHDIFFEPPDPKTYINNDASLNQAPQAITIGVAGGTCPADCKTIYVYPSGIIDVQ